MPRKTQSLAQNEAAVQAQPKSGSSATSSKSIRSRSNTATPAPTTQSGPNRQKLAKFIISRWVKAESILWKRDMPMAYRLIKKYPHYQFWEELIPKYQIEQLPYLFGPKNKVHLQRKFLEFKKRATAQKQIRVDKPDKKWIIGSKQGEDFVPLKKKPLTLLEYCK